MMDRPLGPALWILGFFALYTLTLQLWFTREESIPFVEQEFIVARDDSWSPFDFAGREGQLTAFLDELLVAIAEEEKIVIRIQDLSGGSAGLFPGMARGSFDAALSPILPAGEMVKKFYISPNLYAFGPVVVTRPNSTIHSAQELEGKIVGITQAVEFLMHYPTDPETIYISYKQAGEAFDALMKGHLHAVLAGLFNADKYIHSIYRGQLEIRTAPLTDLGIRLFVPRTARGEVFFRYFTAGLEKVQQSGLYEQLLKKWQLLYISPGAKAGEVVPSHDQDKKENQEIQENTAP